MKVGDIVYSIFPRINGEGHGVVLNYRESISSSLLFIPSKVEVYWPVTGKKEWIRRCHLYTEEEQ